MLGGFGERGRGAALLTPLFGPVPSLREKRQSLENGMQSIWDQFQKKMLKKVREELGGLGGVWSGGAIANKLLSSSTSCI